MKRSVFMMSMLLLVLGAGAVFAEGASESSDQPYGPGARADRWFGSDLATPEEVTVTGKIKFDDGYPILVADGVEYDLMVPRYYTYGIDLSENQELTVTGYLMTAETSRRIDEDEYHLQVTKAIVNGTEYDLGFESGRMGMWDDDDDFRSPRGSRGRMPMRGR